MNRSIGRRDRPDADRNTRSAAYSRILGTGRWGASPAEEGRSSAVRAIKGFSGRSTDEVTPCEEGINRLVALGKGFDELEAC